jgi:hypothetical protein
MFKKLKKLKMFASDATFEECLRLQDISLITERY